MKKQLLQLLFIAVFVIMNTEIFAANVDVTATAGTTTGGYTTLKGAFDAINAGTHQGVITLKINASTAETATAALNASGSGSAVYTSVTLYPTVTGLSISGNIVNSLIDFSGADNVTIDGRVNATGTTKDLTISNANTGTSASTIRFINDATSNSIKYCTLKGATQNTTGGVLFFSTTTGTIGNDNNTIDNNNITGVTTTDANRPTNLIYSSGTAAIENSGNTISNNYLYDFVKATIATNGINISSNSTDWNITGNSIYQTTTVTKTSSVNSYMITIVGGNNYNINDNYIGGTSANCGGTKFTVNGTVIHTFNGVRLNVGTVTATSVQNNVIANLDLTSYPFEGISVLGGSVNIGTITGNQIGSTTSTGSITVSPTTVQGSSYGVNVAGAGTCSINNNSIGGITTAGSHGINVINIQGSGAVTINNNTIGSPTTANSINTGSGAYSNVYPVSGISSFSSGTTIITNNTISNLNCNIYYSPTSLISGIVVGNGVNTVSNNTIHDISNSSVSPSVSGLTCSSTLAGQVITDNVIYNLNALNSNYGAITGLGFYGAASGTNIVSGNFIHSFNTSSTSTSTGLYGIFLGTGTATFFNNIVNIGTSVTLGCNIYGIYDNGGASSNIKIYFNTIYIGGSVSTGSNTYALYSTNNTYTRDFRNNIFMNARSNSAGTAKHYAIRLTGNTGLTNNYNDYYVSGTGGVLGNYNGTDNTTLATWQTSTTQDANSLNTNPSFISPGGTTALSYTRTSTLAGVSGTGVTTDYAGITRAAIPSMGVFDTGGGPVNVTATSGTLAANYLTIKEAFDKINDGTHQGAIVIKINYSTTETSSAILNASASPSSYTSVNIYPTVTGLSITGTLDAPLIDLSGADNVTIDGRVNTTGTTKDLIISNTSTGTSASTIRFINDATSNTVEYCTIKGASQNTAGGVLFFSTTTGTTGNDNNTIDNNDITGVTTADANRPNILIYSEGTTSKENSGNTISNNNLYDFLKATTNNYGVYVYTNNSDWSITGNSFYQTTTVTNSANTSAYAIYVTGNNCTISDNYIGGTSSGCGGSACTIDGNTTRSFTAIQVIGGASTSSSVQNNTIQNIIFNGLTFTGIYAVNNVNIGTVTGNTIGSGSIASSISSNTNPFSNGSFTGMSFGPGTITCSNNIIGGITTSVAGYSFNGFVCNFATLTLTNNTIGSTSIANSINASTTTFANQYVYGIRLAGGTTTVSGNTIANLNNNYSSASSSPATCGIIATNGVNAITNNTIYNLSAIGNNVTGVYSNNTTSGQSISGNTIYNLTSTYVPAGIYCQSSTTGTNTLSGNFIYNVNTVSNFQYVYGMNLATGNMTVANNIISLGTSLSNCTYIYGIYETGNSGTTKSFLFNTVSIGGNSISGSNTYTYGFYSLGTGNTRDIRNNIFSNTRTNTSGSALHYGIYIGSISSLIINANDYYCSSTAIFGRMGSTDYSTIANWKTGTGQDANSLNTLPGIANSSGTSSSDYILYTKLNGVSGTGITVDYSGATRAATPSMGAYESVACIVATATSGTLTGGYLTLKAAFDKINDGTHQGVVSLNIKGSTIETATAVLNSSGGSSNYTSVNIYPSSTGISISGNLDAPLIDLSGADNVTFDGRVNATGSTKDLTILNTSTGSTAGNSTIRFIDDATGNTIKYCNLKGASQITSSGVLFFSTATNGTVGNDNNIIDNNNITGASTADADRPLNLIYSSGTSAKGNSGITISNNNLYDYIKTGSSTNGIRLSSNNPNWTIIGNSFYLTTTVTKTAGSYTGITVSGSSNDCTISGNYIGGTAAACGGTAWTTDGAVSYTFTGIIFSSSSTTASTIQNNTIQNISVKSNSSTPFYGINVNGGNVNIGGASAANGNTIGSGTGTGSITITNTNANPTTAYGIALAGPGSTTITCSNNKIGSITPIASIASSGCNLSAIYSNTTGVVTISDNTIGSTSTANSINASNAPTGSLQYIYSIQNTGAGTISITNNTIANLTNAYAGFSGTVNMCGIYSDDGANTISNNTIYNLSNASGNSSSHMGIYISSSISGQTISGNLIYSLSNTNTGSVSSNVYGIYYMGGSSGTNAVFNNFIHSLGLSSSNTAASLNGIYAASGTTTYYNNIINLGVSISNGYTIYGIYYNTGSSNIYFNTVYIGGSVSAGANTYALFNSSFTTSIRNYKNNLLINARTNSAGSAKHYAVRLPSATNLTIDYNNYYTPGTGGVLGIFAGTDVTTLATWKASTGQDANSLNINPSFASAGGTNAVNYIPSAIMIANTGTGIATDYDLTTRSTIFPTMGAQEGSFATNVVVQATSGTLVYLYTTVKGAFDAINAGTHQGSINIMINASTTETASAVLNASGGTSSYTSVNIYPTTTGLSISGNLNLPLINLNGADNVTIDGRVNATGTTKDLTISNSNTGTGTTNSTIYFIDDATANTIKYCILKGAANSSSAGILFFATSAYTSGNDNNTIDNNDITGVSLTDANRPANLIYSSGSSTATNSGNIISNNNLYDFVKTASTTNGILINTNNSDWTITGNSFYQTTAVAKTSGANSTIINVSTTTGNNFNISNNYIGGTAANCGGSAWTVSGNFNHNFYGMNLTVGTTTASSIQNNIIKNLSTTSSNTNTFYGINILGGNVNIGTVTGNTIGSGTGTGSITATNTTAASNSYGIFLGGSGTINCSNNSIGSITSIGSSSFVHSIYAIRNTNSGTSTISNNTIGSTSTANSIIASSDPSVSGQYVTGISNIGTGTCNITGNIIANLKNSFTGSQATSNTNGISTSNGQNTITTNIIYNISNAGSSPNIGIFQSSTASADQTVSGNTIYNLSNSHTTTASVSVYGIYYSGPTSNTNTVSRNFVHDLNLSTSSASGNIYGIGIQGGNTTYSNNIVSLGTGITTGYNIYGMYDVASTSKVYFNTINIGGVVTTGSSTYALYNAASTNVKDYRNNLFNNGRSNSAGTAKHYAIRLPDYTTLTIDYNDYYTPGTGGVLARNVIVDATTLSAWQSLTSQDANSLSLDPLLASAGGTNAVDYKPASTDILGTAISGITTDYVGTTRTAPSMGAYEVLVDPATTWNGSAWSNGVPSTIKRAIINGNYNGTTFTAKTVTVNASKTLTIVYGESVTTNGLFTNNGTVIIQDGGSLIQGTSSTLAGSGTYQVNKTGSSSVYNYWSSPITVQPVFGVMNYFYNEQDRVDGNYMEGWTGASGNMNIGQGYTAYGAGSKTFSGTVNNGTLTLPVTLTNIDSDPTLNGYNLIGNPYPSPMDISSFLSSNTSSIAGSAVYFWTGSNYVTYNSGNIPVAQGYFVRCIANGNANFSNAYRQAGNNALFKKASVDKSVVVLEIKNGAFTDQTQIEQREEATDGFDVHYDAYKMKGNDDLELYSKIENTKDDYAINITSPGDDKIVSLAYDGKQEGTYSIGIKSESGFDGMELILEDKQLDSLHNLRTSIYEFQGGNVVNDGRFALRFKMPATTSVTSPDNATSILYSYEKTIYAQTEGNFDVMVYNLNGVLIATKSANSNTKINIPYSGIYLVKIIGEKVNESKKVIIE